MARFPARRLCVLALAAVALLPAAGCDGSAERETRVVAIGPEPRLRERAEQFAGPGDELLAGGIAQGLVSFDAAGNIVGGLAERWNVSDDGLSYIFRLAPTKWSDGRKLTAEQVARVLRRALAETSANPLRDTLGAVREVVAMTDRVIEIRLSAPRPNLLALLAQPQLGVMRGRTGTGPFTLAAEPEDGWLVLNREQIVGEDEEKIAEQVLLKGGAAEQALAEFAAGRADLVLGGTFADVPLAQRANVADSALRFDPAAGLFGLTPLRKDGPAGDSEVRERLSRAIDRDAFVAALGVRGLSGRMTLLEPGLDGNIAIAPPAWASLPPAERRGPQPARTGRKASERPRLRLLLPAGPGADLLLQRLQLDWGALGYAVERAERRRDADFELIDLVAPSLSPAWYVRRLRCAVAPVCDPRIDELMDSARATMVAAQRAALIGQAADLADRQSLFIPIAAPVRWAMVAPEIDGFAVNRFARHTLAGLRQPRAARQ